LGKKLYFHCLSHPVVKLGTYIVLYQSTAEKQLCIADAVIPVEKSKNVLVYGNAQQLISKACIHL